MGMKAVKSLRKGDKYRESVSNLHIAYLSWVRVKDIGKIKVWQQPLLPKKEDQIILVTYTVEDGRLRGEEYKRLFFESDNVMTPNKPWKIVRIWRALIS